MRVEVGVKQGVGVRVGVGEGAREGGAKGTPQRATLVTRILPSAFPSWPSTRQKLHSKDPL